MVDGIVKKIFESDVRVAAKLNRDIDDGAPSTRETLEALYRHTGKAYGIGTTGAPGVGKSTLVDQMISALRTSGTTVNVLAVDPTSTFSGGAVPGDRIRMQRHSLCLSAPSPTRGQFGITHRRLHDGNRRQIGRIRVSHYVQ